MSRSVFDAVRRAVEAVGPAELRVSKSQVAFRRCVNFAFGCRCRFGLLNGVLIFSTGAGTSMMLFDRIAPAAVLLCAFGLLARVSGTGSLGALFTVLLLIGGIIRIASVDLSPGADNDLIARAVSLTLSIGTIGFALNAASRLKAAGFEVEVGSDESRLARQASPAARSRRVERVRQAWCNRGLSPRVA